MTLLKIRHRTTYRYDRPVVLGPHRLLLRPREGRDVRLVSSAVTTEPAATLSWAQDVFGNAVATAFFPGMADMLMIESTAEVELAAVAFPIFDIAVDAMSHPFRYSDDERVDLGALLRPRDPAQAEGGQGLASSFVQGGSPGAPTDTLTLLKELNAGIATGIAYQTRADEGTQTPDETLARRCGSCRDFAILFVEAARGLGFGARIVSGYLHNPDPEPTEGEAAADQAVGIRGDGATHAWAEVYVPGAGWIAFDPTNGRVGGFNLVPVAVARNMAQTIPVAGTFSGPAEAFQNMSVEVVVST